MPINPSRNIVNGSSTLSSNKEKWALKRKKRRKVSAQDTQQRKKTIRFPLGVGRDELIQERGHGIFIVLNALCRGHGGGWLLHLGCREGTVSACPLQSSLEQYHAREPALADQCGLPGVRPAPWLWWGVEWLPWIGRRTRQCRRRQGPKKGGLPAKGAA